MEDINLRKLLMKIGISSNIKGFHYIIEGVNIIKNEDVHVKVTNIYQIISEKFNETPSSIERVIRYAISKSFEKNDILKKIYLNAPDNSAFLYDLAFNFDIFLDIIKE